MARMLGRYRRGPVRSCRSMEHLCARCSDGGETRWRKRVEQREWRLEAERLAMAEDPETLVSPEVLDELAAWIEDDD